jgi:outer membrane lipoprotein
MRSLVLVLVMSGLAACAHVVSKESRDMADPGVTLEELFKEPESFRGKTVILGGSIINTTNTDEGTYIEVLQRPLDYRGRPTATDKSLGRFMVFDKDYLEPAIYRKGRKLTVAGEVLGGTLRPLGDIQYRYVLLRSRELRLIKPRYAPRFHFGVGVFHFAD